MANNRIDKEALRQKILSVEGLDNETRTQLLGLLNEKKRYGLVWEEKPEDVEEQLREKLPVLKEVEERRILSDEAESPNHILIEGDNLHALTALTYTHEGKVDVIYIDPPYNTGNKDFIYNDSFVDAEDGYRHSKWLSFMSKRLRIAKKLLSDKGVIFISIDDNEQANLKLLCDEVFGAGNFIKQFIWYVNDGHTDNQDEITHLHEYILCYAKDKKQLKTNYVVDPSVSSDSKILNSFAENSITKNGAKNPPSIVTLKKGFPCEIEVLEKNKHSEFEKLFNDASSTGYITREMTKKHNVSYPVRIDDMNVINGRLVKDCRVFSGWMNNAKLESFMNNDFKPLEEENGSKLRFFLTKNGVIYYRREGRPSHYIQTVIESIGTTETNKYMLESMGVVFNYPKPYTLVQYLLSIYSSSTSLILDFFAGSGTTLHATMQLNAEDGGKRQCILVTNNENNICEEVTYERNKRVINGYTTPKGVQVEGLKNNNLRYYKTEFVDRERTPRNMRQLVSAATDLLCIKENLYAEKSEFGALKLKPQIARYFVKGSKQMLVIYREETIERFVEEIEKMEVAEKIKIYLFAPGRYAFDDVFFSVQDKVSLCALPAAIYDAYQLVLPEKPDRLLDEEEETLKPAVQGTLFDEKEGEA